MAIATGPKVDLDRFYDEGYLVLEDVLDIRTVIEPLVAEYMEVLDGLANHWLAEGRIKSLYPDMPFPQRFARLLSEAGKGSFQPFDISLAFGGITEETPIHLGPAVFNMMRDARLLDAIQQVIGPEITSNPIQHVRIKPPERLLSAEFRGALVSQTDWHQDQGVALPEVDATDMLTVWLPITDATVENGCLCVVPRSHHQGLVTHCSAKAESTRIGLHIPDALRGKNVVPLPIKRGGALFIHRRVQHASLRNDSDGIRWSFDLRYQPTGQPTGRPWFPSWVARSQAHPETEVTDWRDWAALWRAARTNLTNNPPEGKFNRWSGDEQVCEEE